MISLAFSQTVAAVADIQSEADSVAVINAAYNPRPMLKCSFFSNGCLWFKCNTSLLCAESKTQHPALSGCCVKLTAKKWHHQRWCHFAVAFYLFIVLSILSLTYGDFAFNSKTLPIFYQYYSCWKVIVLANHLSFALKSSSQSWQSKKCFSISWATLLGSFVIRILPGTVLISLRLTKCGTIWLNCNSLFCLQRAHWPIYVLAIATSSISMYC